MAARAFGGLSVEIAGDQELLLSFARLATRSPELAGELLHDEATVELEEMRSRTPALSGDLRASGRVHRPAFDGQVIEVTITFGEGLEPYAVAQHEKYWFEHARGEARYVTSVIEESTPFLLQRLGRRFIGGLERVA